MKNRMADVAPKKKTHWEFQQYIDQQPYSVVLDGLRLTIDEDVFPPDMGELAMHFLNEFLHNNRVKENQADRQAVGVMKCLLVSFQTEVPI